MIELEEKTLLSFLYKVKKQATESNEGQFFSWTKEIDKVDLFALFEAAEKLDENRLFWTNSDHNFMMMGIGQAETIIANENRFESVQKGWENLLGNAMVHNPFQKMGTGLVAMGGMTFDPKRKPSKLWEKYPPGRLTIPKYTVVFVDGKYYVTMNQYMTDNDTVRDFVMNLEKWEETLFSSSPTTSKRQGIVMKEEIAPTAWKGSVKKAVQQIKQGKAKKIVLARETRLTLKHDASISDMLRRLQESQPNSYVFAFEEDDNCFIGATPERLVLIEGDALLSTCLAGTAPRGKTVKEDKKIAFELLNDEKNREEHAYVVQMIKENIAPYCKDIEIPDEPVIYPLKNLQHLYTPVKATLKENHTVFDIIKQLHPTPALGGVPREKALQFIREEEYLDRGWYGAPIGWVDSNGNSEFAVALRSGLVQGNEVSLFAGCGIMRDSDPEMEFAETNMKLLPMLHVLEDQDESY